MHQYIEHHLFILTVWSIVVLAGLASLIFIVPPGDFSRNQFVEIPQGMSLADVAYKLEEENVIRSAFAFKVLGKITETDADLKAGTYFFEEGEPAGEILWRLANGDFKLNPVRIRIGEGWSNKQIALHLSGRLPKFDETKFIEKSAPLEGRLYPDTYFFFPTATEDTVIDTLHSNFELKTEDLRKRAELAGHDFEEILVMASLIEKEAWDSEDRRLISSVLWNRIDIGMKLQVDAVFPYIMGKNTFDLTYDDLAFDSPYNTYKYAGLPPGPIANPSRDSIDAALEPVESKYLYYLADMKGVTHFASTFEAHKANKFRYLR